VIQTRYFTGQIPFVPNQQSQSTESNSKGLTPPSTSSLASSFVQPPPEKVKKKGKWRSIRYKQANNIYSAEIKGASHPRARPWGTTSDELLAGLCINMKMQRL